MRYPIFLSLVLAALAGCSNTLTPPLNNVASSDMTAYFWNGTTRLSLDSEKIAGRDSGGMLYISDSGRTSHVVTTLVCRVSADTVQAQEFRPGTVIDLPDKWEFRDGDTTTPGPWHSGGLVLLRSNPTADSSWRAGTIMNGNNYAAFAVEARLLARLDSLDIGNASFADVLVVRYAHEKGANHSVDSAAAPYWVVYYARGIGPIMFDRSAFSSSPSYSRPFERRMVVP